MQTIQARRATGRPQRRRSTAGLTPLQFVTRSFSLPVALVDLLKKAASGREDLNQSAIVSDALANYFGVTVEAPGGGIEKAENRV